MQKWCNYCFFPSWRKRNYCFFPLFPSFSEEGPALFLENTIPIATPSSGTLHYSSHACYLYGLKKKKKSSKVKSLILHGPLLVLVSGCSLEKISECWIFVLCEVALHLYCKAWFLSLCKEQRKRWPLQLPFWKKKSLQSLLRKKPDTYERKIEENENL